MPDRDEEHAGDPPPSDEPKTPKPAIDDAYWFGKSKEIVDAAVTTRDASADRLVDGIKWLWTAYTAGAVVGFAFTEKDYPDWAFALIALPSLILPIAYAFAVWIRNPVGLAFDSRSPPEIEEEYYRAVQEKMTRLRRALGVAGLGVAAVIAALLTAAFAAKDESVGMFSASLDTDQPPLELIASGEFGAGTKVEFTVESQTGENEETLRRTVVAPPDGEVDVRFSVDEAEKYVITATWTEEKVGERSLAKEVKGTKEAQETGAAETTAATTTAPEGAEIPFVELEFYEYPSGRGPKGMATLKDEGGQSLTVTIKLVGAPPEQPPAHIHRGLCESGFRPDAKLGDVVYPLNNIVGGLSETSIDVPLAYFETPDRPGGANKHAIDVHMAEGQDLCTNISFGG